MVVVDKQILEKKAPEEHTADAENHAVLKWSNSMTYQLITLVEKFDKDFQTSVKQFV